MRERAGRLRPPTGGGTQMTGRSRGPGQNQQSIAIAIGADAANLQEMPRGFALGPQSTLAAAPGGDAAGGFSRCQGLAIHIAEHQHGAGAGVLHDDRNEAVHFLSLEGWQLQVRTSLPWARSARSRFGMAMSANCYMLAVSDA